MANLGIFDGLVLALERGQISEREFYAALEEAKRQREPAAQPKAQARAEPKALKFRPSVIRQHFFKIMFFAWLIAVVGRTILPIHEILFPIFLAGILWTRFSHDVTIRNGMIVIEDGIIAKQSTRIRLADIRCVDVRQSVWQRLIGIGDVSITAAGDRPERILQGMDNPSRFTKALSFTTQ